MDIKQLKYFLQICQSNSFSDASKKLFITQQGLSKSIKMLEDEFQLPLFHRNGNRINLTKYGLFLKDESTHIIEEFDSLSYSMKKMSNCNDKKLNLGYSLGTVNGISLDFIHNFKKKFPDIQLNITEYQDFLLEEAVLNEEIDLGFTIGPVDESKFDFKIILFRNMCLIVNNKNKFFKNSQIDFKDIKNEKFILPTKNYKIHQNFISTCRKFGFEPNVIFTTADFNLVTRLSSITEAAGIGVHFNDIPNVKYIPFKDLSCTWELCMITKKGHLKTANEKTFIDSVLSYG